MHLVRIVRPLAEWKKDDVQEKAGKNWGDSKDGVSMGIRLLFLGKCWKVGSWVAMLQLDPTVTEIVEIRPWT